MLQRVSNEQKYLFRSSSTPCESFTHIFYMIYKCKKCNVWKYKKYFYTNRFTECILCLNLRCKEWQQKSGKSESTRKRKQQWSRHKNYGISPQEQEVLFNKQKGKCALCRKRPAETIDHCHKTGKVRSFLCYRCNSGLGAFEDNIKNLKKAIVYLWNH